MPEFASTLTNAIARQYDLFQQSLETIAKERAFLNYGWTDRGRGAGAPGVKNVPIEARQERLCLEVFKAADVRAGHTVVDVGFGSGAQDVVFARHFAFERLIGFNISERQVRAATERAARAELSNRLAFRLGEAESLPGIASSSVDRIVAVECAFYFDRPRFYERAADALKPGGLLVLADIMLSDRLARLTRREDLRRVGTVSANRREWELRFGTRSIRHINRETRPGVQMSVLHILRTIPFVRMSGAERVEWLKMAFYSQLVALGLATGLVRYDLIVLEKPVSPGS